MTRAQVVARLGKPLFENENGFIEYARFPNLFDVYLDVSSTPKRVRLIGISGERFCFPKRLLHVPEGRSRKLKERYRRLAEGRSARERRAGLPGRRELPGMRTSSPTSRPAASARAPASSWSSSASSPDRPAEGGATPDSLG